MKLCQPDWGPSSHSLAFTAELLATRQLVHFLFNAYWESLEFELPPEGADRGRGWRRWIDTALTSGHDIVTWQDAPTVPGPVYRAESRSVVVFFADLR